MSSTRPSSPALPMPDDNLPADAARRARRPTNTFDRTRRVRHDRRRAMAELTIRPEDIRAALDSFVKSYEPTRAVSAAAGRVSLAGDGLSLIHISEPTRLGMISYA